MKSFFRDTTVRVVAAMLFCLGVILFFQHIPKALRWPVRLVCLTSVLWLVFTIFHAVRAAKWSSKKLIFSLLLGGFCYALLSLSCHVFIRLMSPRDDRLAERASTSLYEERRVGIQSMLDGKSYDVYDREVGWVPRPGYKSELYQISPQGLRSLRDYPKTPPDPAKRILCMGDSFTFGYAVGDQETYPYHAEKLRPGTEWINLGISGTCLTQSLLHYRKSGRTYGGKYVVIGFMTNDAQRTVNCFRPFVSPYDPGNPFTKPFAKYSGGRFSIEPNPYQDIAGLGNLLANERVELDRLLQLDYLTWSNQAATRNAILRTGQFVYEAMHVDRNIDSLLDRKPKKTRTKTRKATDPYGQAIWHPDSLGFKALTHLFDLYHSEVIADGRIPIIVIIPGPLDVENHKRQFPRQYDSLLEHFRTKGYRHLDFLDPLVNLHQSDLSQDAIFVQAHFRGSVNQELAEAIIQFIPLP